MAGYHKLHKMAQIFSIRPFLLLAILVLNVSSKALVEKVDQDGIVDPDELLNLVLPSSSLNSTSWSQWDEWNTWEASEDIQKNMNYYRSGYDEDGLVVYVSDFGKTKFRELVEGPEEKVEEFWKHHEQLVRRAEADGAKDNNKGVVLIGNMDEFALKNFASAKALKLALKLFIDLIRLNNAVKYGFLINVNFSAETFINLARPFIGVFLEKLEVYGTLSAKWKPKLLRKIPASQLPPALGGSEGWKPLPSQVTTS